MASNINSFLNAMKAVSAMKQRDQRQRENAFRASLGESYVPRQEAQPEIVPFSEETPGPMMPQEATPEIPGRMDWNNAMLLGAKSGVSPEVMEAKRTYDARSKQPDLPKTVQEWQFYNNLQKDDQIRFLNMKRQGFTIKDIAGVMSRVPLNQGQEVEPLTTLEEESGAQAQIAGARTKAIEEEKRLAKRKAEQPKKKMAAETARARSGLVSDIIDKAISQTNNFSAGPGSLLMAPGSPAVNLSETLRTITANIGFDRLNEMRQAGGGLGSVTENENKLLQSVLGSLEQRQSQSQLKENLKRAKDEIQKSWERTAKAYEEHYGEPMPREGTPLEGTETPNFEGWSITEIK